MTTLRLGVLDVPYGGKNNPPTTGDVATWLENKYHVMQVFYEFNKETITAGITDALSDFLKDRFSGASRNAVSYTAAESDIKKLFNTFIDSKAMDRLGYPGIPTAASLAGVNHRFQHPYAKREPRPSFRDTGLYEASFVASVED